MPLLEAGRLSGHRERRLAYMLLSFMGSGYVWQEGDAGMPKVRPVVATVYNHHPPLYLSFSLVPPSVSVSLSLSLRLSVCVSVCQSFAASLAM
ncbi:hypothetical protein NP493_1370g01006 [Ridgeia piscesae]|uniref:Uncharacterized protein n=1 Tax=Ridgeia piscesae TaxID=27915 RepID=A0AAD9NEJ0_RIDPI|nr:hypothetical protein NP493_1370g01006 [Ridgeia piscesae]